MPKIPLEYRQNKVREFAIEYIPRLNAEFESLTIENKAGDSTPRLRISFRHMLCLVMYEADEWEYSLNWYSSDRRISDEITSSSMSVIGDKMMDDARIHFRHAVKSVDTSQDHTKTYTPAENVEKIISFSKLLGEHHSIFAQMLTKHIKFTSGDGLTIAILTYPRWSYMCSVTYHAGRYIGFWNMDKTRIKTIEHADVNEMVAAVLLDSDEFKLLHVR